MSTEVLSKRVFPVKSEYRLTLRYASLVSATLQVRAIIEDADGNISEIVEDVTTDQSGQQQVSSWLLTPGYLISATVSVVNGYPRIGELYVELSICVTPAGKYVPVTVLFAGYVTAHSNLSWPQSPVLPYDSTSGSLADYYEQGPFTVPAYLYIEDRIGYQVQYIAFRYHADTTGTDRYIYMGVEFTLDPLYKWQSTISQPVASSYWYIGVRGISQPYSWGPAPDGGVHIYFPIPDDLYGNRALRIMVNSYYRGPNDNISNVTVVYTRRVDLY